MQTICTGERREMNWMTARPVLSLFFTELRSLCTPCLTHHQNNAPDIRRVGTLPYIRIVHGRLIITSEANVQVSLAQMVPSDERANVAVNLRRPAITIIEQRH